MNPNSDKPDDGSDKPLGYTTPDGELVVVITNGERHYRETDLGQTRRWMRQAPDLYEMYLKAVESHAQVLAHMTRMSAEHLGREKAWSHDLQQIESDRIANLEDLEKQCQELATLYDKQGMDAGGDQRMLGAGDAFEQIAKMLRDERLALSPADPERDAREREAREQAQAGGE